MHYSKALVFIALIVFLLSPNFGIADTLTSIKIGEKNYSLRTYDEDEIPGLLNELKEENLWYKNCSMAVDLPVGVANGNHSYGFVCDAGQDKVIYCHDIMLGRHKEKTIEKTADVELTELVGFVIDHCYGG